jgi:pimeloyl-ACP methyl ester carboxylesterase
MTQAQETKAEVRVDGAVLNAQWRLHPTSKLAPLVFLHAGVADTRMWQGAWDHFGAQRTVLRYDRRGFGASRTVHAQPHTRVADLFAVMDAAGLQQAVLVGCSQGGRVAIDATLARPERVLGLVPVAPGVGGTPDFDYSGPSRELDEAADAAVAARDFDRANALMAHLWLDGPAGPVGRVGGAVRETFLAMNHLALHATDPGPAQDGEGAWARLGEIRAPTLVMCGSLDLPFLLRMCRELARQIPGARYTELPGLAHLPSLEAPAVFNTALAAFVDTL